MLSNLNIYYKNKLGTGGFFLLLAVIIICAVVFTANIPFKSTSANADTIPSAKTSLLTGNGIDVDISQSNLNNKTVNIYDNYAEAFAYLTAASHDGAQNTNLGDFNIANWTPEYSALDAIVIGGKSYSGFYVNSSTSAPTNATITVSIPIVAGSPIARAINDEMLNVQITALCRQKNMSLGNGEDGASSTLYYSASSSSAKLELTSGNVRFPAVPNENNDYQITPLVSFPKTDACANGAYITLQLHDFYMQGSNFLMALSKIYFKVQISLKEDVVFKNYDNYSNIQVISTNDSRSESATPNMLKEGDVVVIKNEFLQGTSSLKATSGLTTDTATAGAFYRDVFLKARYGTVKVTSNEGKDIYTAQDIVKWSFNTDAFTRIYPNDIGDNGIDLSNEYSALYAAFRVKGGNFTQLTIKCSLITDMGISLLEGNTYSFIVDNQKANSPILDSNTTFYQKYITEKKYYTNVNSYNEVVDESGNTNIESVTIGSQKDKTDIKLPDYASALKGESPETIYYKVTRLAYETNNIEYIPFSKEEATGIFCQIIPKAAGGANVYYSGINLSLSDGEGGYLKSGIYKVEFVTYDHVGNIAYGNSPYVVRVDVADYVFDIITEVGNNVASNMIENGVFALYSYALSDDGELVVRNNASFKRGDRVVLKLDFSNSGYSSYILTEFRTPAGDSVNTSTFPYTNAGVVYITNYNQSASIPTFVITSGYAGDENAANRQIILKFKSRINISVTNTIHTYSPGTPRSVNATAIDSSTGRTLNITITKTYSETKDGNYRPVDSTFPINAGTYYYRCEIKSAQYYGFKEGTMNIKKAVPVVNNVSIIAINYGESLKSRDTSFNEITGKYEPTNTITCIYTYYDSDLHSDVNIPAYNRSSDGVYGYFSIVEPSPFDVGDLYSHPTAGVKNIKVKFTPVIYSGNEPQYDENGNFILNNNYNSVTVSGVTLTVKPSTKVNLKVNNINADGIVISEYNDSSQNIDITITATEGVDGSGQPRILDLEDFIIYSFSKDGGATFDSQVPIDAGNYIVKYRLDTSNSQCNYTGEWQQAFVIDKKRLTIIANDSTYAFQKEEKPFVFSKRIDGAVEQDYNNLQYSFKFYYYDEDISQWSFIKNADDKYLVPADKLFNGLPSDAGKYIAEIEINEKNYKGDQRKFINYKIEKVSILDGVNVKYLFPSLSWVNLTTNNHLNYLQQLGAVNFNITNDTVIQYNYHYMDLGKVKYHWQTVPGSFIISHSIYAGDCSVESVAEFVEAERTYTGLNVGTQNAYMYFIPNQNYLVNFDLLYIQYNINVGKAEPIFTDLQVEDIIYGEKISGIDDLNITKNIKFELNENEYVTIPQDEYSYELYNMESGLLSAGLHNVIITFIPSDTIRFTQVQGTVTLNVEQKHVEIIPSTAGYTFTKEEINGKEENVYNFYYKGYKNISYSFAEGSLVDGGSTPKCEYKIFKYNNGFDGVQTEYNQPTLSVGQYYVKIICTSNNYSGEGGYYVNINKAELIKNADPSVNQAATSVAYGKLLKQVNFSGGQVVSAVTGEQVSGHFEFNCDDDAAFNEVGIKVFKLQFVPTDTINYQIYTGRNGSGGTFNVYTISVNVSRADLSAEMTLTVDRNYIYGEWDYNLDLSTITAYSTSKFTNGSSFSNLKIDDSYHYLDVTYAINNRPKQGKFNAGEYTITITVDESKQNFYKGIKTVKTVLQKQTATIVPYGDYKVFSNKSQTLDCRIYACDKDGNIAVGAQALSEQIIKTYYRSNYSEMSEAPAGIGKYFVRIKLNSQNYKYYQEDYPILPFTIGVDNKQIIVNNLNQMFASPRSLVVALGGNKAVYTLSYISVISGKLEINEYGIRTDSDAVINETDQLPVNAGEYYVAFNFGASSNNGYEKQIIFGDVLVIEKAEAAIMASDVVRTTYTGKPYALSVRTEPYNLNYYLTYSKQGSTDFSEEEIFDANTNGSYHQIKVTVESANYKGTKIIKFYILPADLAIKALPKFGDYVYNSDKGPILIDSGEVIFGTDTLISGEFGIDLEQIKTKDTGKYSVNYVFKAMKNGAVDTNFNIITAKTEISIIKKQIDEEFIVFAAGQKLNTEYNMQYHTINAVLDGFEVFDINGKNNDFKINVKYNGELTPIRARGEYIISAAINSKNYSGSKTFDTPLIIGQGTPDIRVMPKLLESTVVTVTKDASGEIVFPTIKDSDIIQGEAFIKNTDNRLQGVYAVYGNGQTTKANINIVKVKFMPFDTNFGSVIIDMPINVIGENIIECESTDLGNVSEKALIFLNAVADERQTVYIKAFSKSGIGRYGASLNDFTLRFTDIDGNDLAEINNLGALSFIDKNYIPNVAEAVDFKFVPYESINSAYYDNLANIMYGKIVPEIEKQAISDSIEWDFVGFAGYSINEKYRLDLLGADGFETGFGASAISFYTDKDKAVLFDTEKLLDFDDNQTTVYLVAEFNNYENFEGLVTLQVRQEIEEININVNNLKKEYSGEKLTADDLGLKTGILNADVKLYIYDNLDNLCDGIEIGVYRIDIIVKSDEYYGRKIIDSFEIVRKDISKEITLSRNTAVYNSIALPKIIYNGENLDESCYTLSYKGENASTYTGNLSNSAGKYLVKVVVNCEHYEGTAIFDFEVQALLVDADTYPISVVYNSLEQSQAFDITFLKHDTTEIISLDYALYYYSENYSISTVRPQNVGYYTVRLIIKDKNYLPNYENGYAEFSYTVKSAQVMVKDTEEPEIKVIESSKGKHYNLVYGQSCANLKLIGGIARSNNLPVNGRFEVADSTKLPSAGEATVKILFVPDNGNYETVTFTKTIYVAKGNAQVTVDNLYAQYDGTEKSSYLTSIIQPSGVPFKLTFKDMDGQTTEMPTNAGTYLIEVNSLSDNYDIVITTYGENKITPYLVISKASVDKNADGTDKVFAPKALKITCGDNLTKSSLTSEGTYGKVFYKGFIKPIEGDFYFVSEGLIFHSAGTFSVDYKFVPKDYLNFNTYFGTVEIKVEMGFAAISVTNTEFVYGEGFTFPTFTTNPKGLEVAHNITFKEYNPASPDFDYNYVIPAGTYEFEVWVVSENYKREDNKLRFTIHIAKKEIDLSFVDENGNEIRSYTTTYGKALDAKIKLYEINNSLDKKGYFPEDYIVNNVKITDRLYINYKSTSSDISYDSRVAPTDRGNYELTISINNNNYKAEGTIPYYIKRGVISTVTFDTKTLENQIYGNVIEPNISTEPNGISYYIVYHGYSQMPKNAGTYNITVYFDDDNYEKKQISAMFKINPLKITVVNIQVDDKVYDGVAALEISGKLQGVFVGDEVALELKAHTADNKTSIGKHDVVISEYRLKGYDAANYQLERPQYNEQINILTKKVQSPSSSSYVTSTAGFKSGTTLDVSIMDSAQNKTNAFSKAMGLETVVVGYTIKVNGQETILKEKVKVYIAIPEEFQDSENLEYTGTGNLAGQNVIFTREGEFITFTANASGGVAFSKREFRYTTVVGMVSLVIIIVGVIIMIILNPLQNRKAVMDPYKRKKAIKKIKRGY